MQRSKLYFLASLLLSCAFTQHAEPFVARAYYSTAEAQLAQTGAGGSGTGAKVFLSAAGNDSNDCLTPLTSCLTPSHVSGLAFVGLKVTINLNGGDTIGGGTSGFVLTTAFTTASVSIQDYGTGQATVSTGNSAACVSITNLPAPSIVNIICTGGGNTTNTTAGISIVNSQAGNTKLGGPSISGVTLSGYGYNGISIQGASGTSGFNGITIAGNTINNVTGNSADAFGTCGIFVFSKTGYGSGFTTPSHTNVTITGNSVTNATGYSGASANWSGCGIFVSQSGGTITIGGSPSAANFVNNFGGNNGSTLEPVGIWIADGGATNGGTCQISYNEVIAGQTGLAGAKSDAFAFDGGTVGCIGEKNKVHDNSGVGWLLENYSDGTCCALWANNTVRDNLFQNNAYSSALLSQIGFHFVANATGPAYVYNNTVIAENFSNAIGDIASSTSAITANIWNNIFVATVGGALVNFTNTTAINLAGNDYYTYGAAAKFFWTATTYSNASVATAFAAWQTATGQEKIAGNNVGLTSNPQIYVPGGLFTTNGYFPLKDMASNLQTGSAMLGAGLNIQSLFGVNPGTTDYYGAAISAASLPVGAANGDFATFASSCTAATNFLARVSGFNKLDNVNYDSLLCADSIVSLLDLLYIPAAPNLTAALLNLVNSNFNLTSHGSPVFIARHGIAGDGSSAYLDTGWIPSVNGSNYTLTSVTHLGYSLTDGASDAQALYGVQNSAGTSETSNFPGSGSGWYSDANDFSGRTLGSITTSKGLFLLNRTGNVLTPWLNEVVQGPDSPAPVAVPNQNMILLAFNAGTGSGIVANSFGTEQIAAVAFGSGTLDSAGISRVINSFMQAYGINVY